jgi:hypothetical protein
MVEEGVLVSRLWLARFNVPVILAPLLRFSVPTVWVKLAVAFGRIFTTAPFATLSSPETVRGEEVVAAVVSTLTVPPVTDAPVNVLAALASSKVPAPVLVRVPPRMAPPLKVYVPEVLLTAVSVGVTPVAAMFTAPTAALVKLVKSPLLKLDGVAVPEMSQGLFAAVVSQVPPT